MSRSKHAVELCALLVDEIYGELTSRIFTILLRRGRLQITQLTRHSRLTTSQVSNGLAVLVQQGLAYHNYEVDSRTTFYEANHDAAYGLVRSGKILEAVESRFGVTAKNVVQNMLLLGHAKVSDFEKVYESKANGHANGNGQSNGVSENGKTPEISNGQLHAVLSRLLEARVIQPVVKSMFRSFQDTHDMVGRELLKSNFAGETKGKQKDELDNLIRDRLRAIRSEGQDWRPKGNKRPLHGAHSNGTNGATKRRRLSNSGTSVNTFQYEDDGTRVEPELILRVNYEKCVVMLRNQRLVALAHDRIGETTSQIYAQALDLMEDKIQRCRLDPNVDETGEDIEIPRPTITTMEIAAALSRSINTSRGIGKESDLAQATAATSKKAKKRRPNDDSEEDEVMADTNGHANGDGEDLEDIKPAKRARVTFQEEPLTPASGEDSENRLLQIKKHLQILEADECRFVKKGNSRGQGEWFVEFEHIIEYMQNTELDLMMLENFGQDGHRLARVLRKLGKLDEKQLPNIALMKQKDIRTKLAEMQMAGVIDIQEVPRDPARTTNRTIFLWYFDSERVSAILLDKIYKTMSRCVQRLDVEKRRAHEILTLTERSDVRDLPPEQYLEPAQLAVLQEIRGKEQMLLGQIGRLDEMIGVFRDY